MAMLRCSYCGNHLQRSSICSDLAILTLHWMSRHRDAWLKLHPEDEQYI